MENSSKGPNLREDIFLALYEAVKDKLGEFYEGKSLTLGELVALLVPIMTSVVRDHVDQMQNITVEQKHEAFTETMMFIIKMFNQMAVYNPGRFDAAGPKQPN